MTRVANALHVKQMKVGTRRRRAPVADLYPKSESRQKPTITTSNKEIKTIYKKQLFITNPTSFLKRGGVCK